MQTPVGGNPAVERVWGAFSAEVRETLTVGMTPTDLQTLLLSVAQARARQVNVARLMRRWQQDRFVRPAVADPRKLASLNARLWDLLPVEFAGIVLAPVALLGTCGAVAAVEQNWIVSTVRGSEVVSDPSNVLAIEAAHRRQRTDDEVHLASCHRALRGQRFDDPDALAHFELLTLVSSGHDHGGHRTELGFLEFHLRTWSRLLSAIVGEDAYTMEFSTFGDQQLAGLIRERIQLGLPRLVENSARTRAVGYYRGVAIRLIAQTDGREYEIGDGGATDWTAQLLSNAKERCLISCVATERLLAAMP